MEDTKESHKNPLLEQSKGSKNKKFIVLGVLFLLPLTMYMFFATGKDNFVKLPTITENVIELKAFKNLEGNPIQFKDRITVIAFFGNSVEAKKANAFNLAHKIYKKNYEFKEFQFVTLITENQKDDALKLKVKISEIENPENWTFGIGSEEDIEKVFTSFECLFTLDENFGNNHVFIIDKEGDLRGRDDDEDSYNGILYGYNASDYAEINNKMSDDIKVVLAEYRLALKKYKAERKDDFRDTHLKKS